MRTGPCRTVCIRGTPFPITTPVERHCRDEHTPGVPVDRPFMPATHVAYATSGRSAHAFAKAGEEQCNGQAVDGVGHGFGRARKPPADLVGAQSDP